MRTSQKERKENARRFYNRFIAVPGSLASMEKPIVLAESPSGMVGCFMEFLDNIKHCKQVSYYDDGFSSWLYDTYHFRITYRDGLVFMFERD